MLPLLGKNQDSVIVTVLTELFQLCIVLLLCFKWGEMRWEAHLARTGRL